MCLARGVAAQAGAPKCPRGERKRGIRGPGRRRDETKIGAQVEPSAYPRLGSSWALSLMMDGGAACGVEQGKKLGRFPVGAKGRWRVDGTCGACILP